MIVQNFCLLAFVCLANAKLDINYSDTGPEKLTFNISEADELFQEFLVTYHKEYRNKTEYEYRLEVFKKHLQDMNKRNKVSLTEVFGITEFSDLTPEEFEKEYTGFDAKLLKNETVKSAPLVMKQENVPSHWDWRQKGAVTPVKQQGRCGSCWAFGAVGVVEGQYYKKYGKLLALSNQQMVDCYHAGGGCRTGSYPHRAFLEAARVGGYMAETDYPYRGSEGYCKFNPSQVRVRVTGGRPVFAGTEEVLKQLVYTYGPVSIGIYAHSYAFAEYKGGIAHANTLSCAPDSQINHAVLVVGYGTENGEPYWIIKNSFGQHWGEHGYMKLRRGNNPCNILQYAAIADIA